MPAQLSETLIEIASRRFDLLPQLPSRHGARAEAGDRCAFHQIIRSNGDLVAVGVFGRQSFDDTVCGVVGSGIEDLDAVGGLASVGLTPLPSKTTVTCQSVLSCRPVSILTSDSRATAVRLACWSVKSGH